MEEHCFDLTEEDLAFFHQLQTPHENCFHDDEIIDDGELWDDIEPTEIDKDICGDSSIPFSIDHDTVDINVRTSQSHHLPAAW